MGSESCFVATRAMKQSRADIAPRASSSLKFGPEHEAQMVYERADHRDFEIARGRGSGCRSLLCRKHVVSDASIYQWKAKFGGMDVSEAKRLRSLEDENTKLKRLLADAMLDAALKDLLGKKW
jgi:putative transposase